MFVWSLFQKFKKACQSKKSSSEKIVLAGKRLPLNYYCSVAISWCGSEAPPSLAWKAHSKYFHIHLNTTLGMFSNSILQFRYFDILTTHKQRTKKKQTSFPWGAF